MSERTHDIEKVKEEFSTQGYSLVEDAVEPEMVDRLEAAARRVWAKVRAGEVDVAGNGPEATAIFGVIAPEFGEPVFAEHLVSPSIERYVKAFLGPDLRMGHVHLWCADKGYDTGWHRDIGTGNQDGDPEREMALITQPMTGLRWQLALVDDPCLWLVPGSHLRPRTPEEHQALAVDKKVDITGQQNIFLQRGQVLFWSGYTIHRGRQPAHLPQRLSMTGALMIYRPDEPQTEVDERFRWKLADNVRAALPPKAQLYYDRWRTLQKA